ncbi:MAG: enoyl-CoA hydratase/isomerase family protein [Acidimicrobiales bacterium]
MSDHAEYETIEWAQDGHVLLLTLNRPEQMNALSEQLETELHDALRAAVKDDEIRSIVLTGAGKAFCAGYDIADEEAAEGPTRTRDVVRRWWDVNTPIASKHLAVMRLEKPVIAAVNGWCLGGGMWYALCCDITIASDRAVFGQPEVREIQGSTFLLAALAGWKHAHRYALTGDHFDAREAERIGIVNEVVPHEELIDRAMALAQRIALLPPDSVRMNKLITTLGMEAMGLRVALETGGLLSVITQSYGDAPELDELNRVRAAEGLAASLRIRDTPFLPEPGGPRSRAR